MLVACLQIRRLSGKSRRRALEVPACALPLLGLGAASSEAKPLRNSEHRRPSAAAGAPADASARSARPRLRSAGLAGVEGFEPTTLGFGDRCSNQTELHS